MTLAAHKHSSSVMDFLWVQLRRPCVRPEDTNVSLHPWWNGGDDAGEEWVMCSESSPPTYTRRAGRHAESCRTNNEITRHRMSLNHRQTPLPHPPRNTSVSVNAQIPWPLNCNDVTICSTRLQLHKFRGSGEKNGGIITLNLLSLSLVNACKHKMSQHVHATAKAKFAGKKNAHGVGNMKEHEGHPPIPPRLQHVVCYSEFCLLLLCIHWGCDW